MSAGPPDTETVETGASSVVRRGWPQAIRGALLAALCVAALGQVVAFLAFLAGGLADASAGQAARYGWALFYAFHHVGLAFRSPDLRLPAWGSLEGWSGLVRSAVVWAGLSDPTLEINLTPNRADCASVHGIARDLSAADMGLLKQGQIKPIMGAFASPVKLTVDAGGLLAVSTSK